MYTSIRSCCDHGLAQEIDHKDARIPALESAPCTGRLVPLGFLDAGGFGQDRGKLGEGRREVGPESHASDPWNGVLALGPSSISWPDQRSLQRTYAWRERSAGQVLESAFVTRLHAGRAKLK